MKCEDCEGYYNGCDTEVYTMGYDIDNCEDCPLFKSMKEREVQDERF